MATTWNPLYVMEALHRDIERAFGNNAGVANEPFSRVAFLPGRAARRYPMMNLYEDRDHVYVEALALALAKHSTIPIQPLEIQHPLTHMTMPTLMHPHHTVDPFDRTAGPNRLPQQLIHLHYRHPATGGKVDYKALVPSRPRNATDRPLHPWHA